MKRIPQCEHIKTNGTRCGSPALRSRKFCYFHHVAHDLRYLRRSRPQARFELPLLEDANAVQMAIQQVAEAVLDERIDNKRAGLLLFALQTAACNLKNVDFEPKRLQDPIQLSAVNPLIEILLKEMNLLPDDSPRVDEMKKPPISVESAAGPTASQIPAL